MGRLVHGLASSIAFVVMIATIPPAAAASGPAPQIPNAELLRAANRAAARGGGSVIVERFVLADSAHWVREGLRLLPGRIAIQSSATMPRAWGQKLTRLLLRDSLFSGLETLDAPGDGTPPVAVRYGEDPDGLEFRIHLGYRRAQVILDGGPLGLVRLRPVAEEVLALVRQAFPEDPAFRELPPVVPLPVSETVRFAFEDLDTQLPEALDRVAPRYPPAAIERGVSGTVWIRTLVGRSGRVEDALVVHSVPLLDRAAVDAVRQWTFAPARLDGRPHTVWVMIPVKFSLH